MLLSPEVSLPQNTDVLRRDRRLSGSEEQFITVGKKNQSSILAQVP